MLNKFTIWDWHGDEYNRLKFYINEAERYIGEEFPNCDKLIMPEGYWMYYIPVELRSNIIIYPCVKDLDNIKNLGYKYALVKDKEQQLNWGINDSVILPPVFNDFNEEKIFINEIITMINYFNRRDPINYQLCQHYGIKNYGYPDNPTELDNSILNSTRYLFHPKEIGYLCNVVIKAINVGTPIIFTSRSYEFGYKDYIKYPLIADTKEQLDNILASEKIYNDYVDYLKEVKQNILYMQEVAKIKVVEFLNKIC